MSNSSTFLSAVTAGVMALGTMAVANNAEAGKGKEKCYGVVKAGQNTCGAADGSHSCAGMATIDGSLDEWVYVPEGLCAKLVNGTLTPGGDDE